MSSREFLLSALFGALPFLAVGGVFASTASDSLLEKVEVTEDVSKGITLERSDREVLNLIRAYSEKQFLVGGCVLARSAGRPCEVVRIAALVTDVLALAKSLNLPEAPWANGISELNTLCFEYSGQKYVVENVDVLEQDARIDFAHEALIYDLGTHELMDPFDALAPGESLTLKHVGTKQDALFVFKTLTESEAFGLVIPDSVLKLIQSTLRDAPSDAESVFNLLVASISRISHLHRPQTVAGLIRSPFMAKALKLHGGISAELTVDSFRYYRTRLDNRVPDGAIWHQSLKNSGNSKSGRISNSVDSASLLNKYFTKKDLKALKKLKLGRLNAIPEA